jgi:CRISPR-associated protein Cmr4
MEMKKALLTLYATAYLHPGAGSTTDVIDLPIQREVHSGLPVIPASSLKGALRQKADEERGDVEVIFGPETQGADKHAGALLVGEAKLLALPVRSLTNIFQWVSSPLVLNRLRRDLARIGENLPDIPTPQKEGQAIVPSGSGGGRRIFEDLDFEVRESEELSGVLREIKDKLLPAGAGEYLLDKFTKDFAFVGDDEFRHLCRVGTQVSARIELDENKTSKNLWYEESLPPETVFYAILLAQGSRDGTKLSEDEVMSGLDEYAIRPSDGLVQIGGNETIGQGWCLAKLFDEETRR